MKIVTVSVLVSAFALAGCAGGKKQDEYSELVAKAENEIALAAKTGFLWSNTEKFLKDSKEAKAAGDMDKAVKLAKKALEEATLAQKQAADNANPRANYSLKP